MFVLKAGILAAVAGVLFIVGTGRVNDLRSELSGLRTNWFEAVAKPAAQADKQRQAWEAVAAEANSICTDHAEDELNLRAALPHNRAEYFRVVGAVLERERLKLAALRALEAPPNYDISYSHFLRDREAALSALERLRQAVKAKDRRKAVRAARSAFRVQASINGYVQSAGMPACRM
jgi:hypothetical protein